MFGVTACSGSRTSSFGGEESISKGTNNCKTRECDQKGMGTLASEICTLAAGGDNDRPGSEGHDSRDISSVKECIRSQRDFRNGGSASETGDDGGLRDSEGGGNSGNGKYRFGISAGRNRYGSSGDVGFESGSYGSKEGSNGFGYRGRLSYEGRRDESVQPPEYRNGSGPENSSCTQSPGNREFGSRDVRNSGGIVRSPIISESGKYNLGNRINPGGSMFALGIQVDFGRGGHDEPTYESGRDDSIPPPEYGSCYEGERSSGSRRLGSQGISGDGKNSPQPYETGEHSSGSDICGSKGSGLTGTTEERSGSGNAEYGSRIMSNPIGGMSSSGVYGTRRYSSGM